MEPLKTDNVQIRNRFGGVGADFLSVTFNQPTLERPAAVSLCLYTIPGRIDTYNFDYAPSRQSGVGSRIRYFTDTDLSLLRAAALVQKDLNRKEVVLMLLRVAANAESGRYYARLLLSLLGSIGPKTKSYRAVNRLVEADRDRKRRGLPASKVQGAIEAEVAALHRGDTSWRSGKSRATPAKGSGRTSRPRSATSRRSTASRSRSAARGSLQPT